MPKFTTSQLSEFCTTPRTVKEIAVQFSVDPLTVRKHLVTWLSQSVLVTSGQRPAGGRGRPSTLFVTQTKTLETSV